MFTPAPSRPEDGTNVPPPASRMPSGSSLLFPSSVGKSPISLAAASSQVPFLSMPQTPGAGVDTTMFGAPGTQARGGTTGAARNPFAGVTPNPSMFPRTPFAPMTGGGEHWVTAFGYPGPAMLSLVLEELRPSAGDLLLEHRHGAGPWVHVRLADWRQQQQALSKNGKVVHGFMLGVVEGIHPPGDFGIDASAAAQAAQAALAGGGNGASAVPLRLQQHRHVGPTLRAPHVAASDLGKAGAWTRACEFVFGW